MLFVVDFSHIIAVLCDIYISKIMNVFNKNRCIVLVDIITRYVIQFSEIFFLYMLDR